MDPPYYASYYANRSGRSEVKWLFISPEEVVSVRVSSRQSGSCKNKPSGESVAMKGREGVKPY